MSALEADSATPGSSQTSTTHTSPASSLDAADETPVKRPSAPARRKREFEGETTEGEQDWNSHSREDLISHVQRLQREREDAASRAELASTSLSDITDRYNALAGDLEDMELRNREGLAQQARLEDDLASRIEVGEKLRSQLQDAERSRRETDKRYREQSASFDADRQAWLDSERHLQSRIASLSRSSLNSRRQAQLKPAPDVAVDSMATEVDAEEADNLAPLSVVRSTSLGTGSGRSTPSQSEPALLSQVVKELEEQYDALLTSYDSLNKSHDVLVDEASDLKRINRELMDHQESYEVLLGERTLSGEVLGQGMVVRLGESATTSPVQTFSSPKNERIAETYEVTGAGTGSTGAVAAETTPGPRRKRMEPALGGMDLAAELDRATETEAEVAEREAEEDRLRNQQSQIGLDMPQDVAALQSEVKMLREANKALSLYISRILDRIQASGHFEHVLVGESAHRSPKSSDASRRGRPSSIIYKSSTPTIRHSADLGSMPMSPNPPRSSPTLLNPHTNRPLPPSPTQDRNSIPVSASMQDRASKRTSLASIATSLWSANAKDKPLVSPTPRPAGFRPMLLGTGATVTGPAPVAPTGIRQLDNEEDEEDAQIREHLHAELRLHGIDPHGHVSKRANYASPSLLARSPPPQGQVWSVDSSPASALPLSRSQSGAGGTPIVPSREVGDALSRAGGLTEIRGHRRRPSSNLSRHTSDSSGLGISSAVAEQQEREQQQQQPLPPSSPGPTEEETEGDDTVVGESGWTRTAKRMSSFFGA